MSTRIRSAFRAAPALRAAVLLLATFAAACGSDDSSPETDTGRTGRTDTGADVVEEVGADVGGTDATDVGAEPDAPDTCGDGVVDEGESCDDGNDVDDDECTNQCWPYGAGLCRACSDDVVCGGSSDRCIDVGGVMSCSQACSTTDRCPAGYACQPVVRDGQVLEDQCVPLTNDCSVCSDVDEDGVCDFEDQCDGFDDAEDGDGDGVPDGCDECPEDNPNDTDSDGVCDSDDLCEGGDDNLDADGDTVPDLCDPCPFSDPDDADEDGVCGNVDRCEGHDDAGEDLDQDRIPDACDDAIELCDDGSDNDGDDIVDCADSDCRFHTACGPCETGTSIGLGTTESATEGDDRLTPSTAGCGAGGGAEHVFVFTPESDGTHCASTQGSEFDTILYVRTDCEDGETELTCRDDATSGTHSEVEFDASAGTPISLIVDGYDASEAGAVSLNVLEGDCASAAVRRTCDAAEAVGNGTHTGELPIGSGAVGAAEECTFASGGEIVFAYTAPATGNVCMTARGADDFSGIDAMIYVRTACTESATEVACNDDQDAFTSDARVQLAVTEGETYFVFVDEYGGMFGGFGGPVELVIAAGGC